MELCCCFRKDFTDFSVVVMTNVLIADVLKHFTWEFSALVALGVDEMTEISPGTACRTMKILTRNSSVVTWLNELVRVWRRVQS